MSAFSVDARPAKLPAFRLFRFRRAIGVVNAVIQHEDLSATAFEAARRLAAKPVEALRTARRLIRGDRAEIAAAMDRERTAFTAALASPAARTAFAAFLNKNKA